MTTLVTQSIKDKTLLKLASQGKSPAEIAAETGGDPSAVYARVTELLSQRDVWSELQQRQLLLHSAYKLKEKVDGWLDSDEFNHDGVSSYLRTLRTIGEILDSQSKITDKDLATVKDANVQYMLRMISAGFDAIKNHLAYNHPEVDIEELDGLFREALRGKQVTA